MGFCSASTSDRICTGTLIGCQHLPHRRALRRRSLQPGRSPRLLPAPRLRLRHRRGRQSRLDPFVQQRRGGGHALLDVTGIAPARINTVAEPPLGSLVDMVGFGSIGDASPGQRRPTGRDPATRRRRHLVLRHGARFEPRLLLVHESARPAGHRLQHLLRRLGRPDVRHRSPGSAPRSSASPRASATRPAYRPRCRSTPTSPSTTIGSWAPRLETSRPSSAARCPPRSAPTPRSRSTMTR